MTRLLLLPDYQTNILLETPYSASRLAKAVNDGCLPEEILKNYPPPIPNLCAMCIGGQVVVFPAGQQANPNSIPVQFSQRHRQVLAGLAEGLTSGQIASRLKISSRTVEAHISHIRKLIGAGSRHQLVARAVTLGLIPFPPAPPH